MAFAIIRATNLCSAWMHLRGSVVLSSPLLCCNLPSSNLTQLTTQQCYSWLVMEFISPLCGM